MKTTVEGSVTTTTFDEGERSILTTTFAECGAERHPDRHADCSGLLKIEGKYVLCICCCHLVLGSGN
jgi:hypothetical protein